MKTHLEETLHAANEARYKAYANADPIWHAVADLEVGRVVQLGRAALASDELTDEPCGFVPVDMGPIVEFAPVVPVDEWWELVRPMPLPELPKAVNS